MTPALLTLAPDEIIVDSFAGGGGASEGIRLALDRDPDIAINHDAEAIAMHEANHPTTKHYPENVWEVDPVAACRGRRVGLAWFSPDCTHFSKAKGAKPVSRKIRALAWVAYRWARAVRPRIIALENVEEFLGWGPVLRATGRPCPARKGQTFRKFVRRLRLLGYTVEWRELRACDYGAPTTRKRLFLVARCDGQPIRWPAPTHGPGRAHPYRTAAECIDWSLACPSIFLTAAQAKALGLRVKRPLAAATMRRIARGVQRFVIEAAEPFIVGYTRTSVPASIARPLPTEMQREHNALVVPSIIPVTHQGDSRVHDVREPMPTITAAHRGEHALVAPTLIQTGYGEDKKRNGGKGQAPRVPGLDKPLGTQMAQGAKHALVAAFLAKHYGDTGQRPGSAMTEPVDTITQHDHHALVASSLVKLRGTSKDGQPVTEPMPTLTAQGNHIAEVRAFLVAYYGNEKDGQGLREPMRTVTARDRMGLVTVHGETYQIADIGMRMLTPRERFNAQGFRRDYVIDVLFNGKPLTQEAQGRMCGNSVPPDMAAAIVRANVGGGAVEPLPQQLEMLSEAAA